jgi:class 3 adenylate cyclase
MGPPSSPNPSAIGDNVNIAARLEAQCKTYGVTLVVSEDAAPVRGREEPVVVYAVPDPLTIRELITINTRHEAIPDDPIV